jgi:hypothetical protein
MTAIGIYTPTAVDSDASVGRYQDRATPSPAPTSRAIATFLGGATATTGPANQRAEVLASGKPPGTPVIEGCHGSRAATSRPVPFTTITCSVHILIAAVTTSKSTRAASPATTINLGGTDVSVSAIHSDMHVMINRDIPHHQEGHRRIRLIGGKPDLVMALTFPSHG